MISSINFSVKKFFIFIICLTLLSVSSAVENPEVSAQDIPAPIEFKLLTSDKSPPQTPMTTIRWTVLSTGGTGDRTYDFYIYDGSEVKHAQAGSSPHWDWTPVKDGMYSLRVVIRDTLGNYADSGWSPYFEIAPELLVKNAVSDKPTPQVEKTSIRWTAGAAGGVGAYTYEFRTLKDREENVVQTGPSPTLDWKPGEPGIYRIKVAVSDRSGNTAESGWSPEYEIVPELQVKQAVYDKPPPQAAAMTSIRWTASAAGGVGAYTYEFRTLKDREENVVQTGPSPTLDWKPGEPGIYRIKVAVSDRSGNTAESGWSPEYEIVPELQVEAMPDRQAPRILMTTIRWTAEATGGVGAYRYEFHALKDKEESGMQTGRSPEWDWKPGEPGIYRIKVIVRDALGNAADSGWSPEYEIVPELTFEEVVPDRPAPQAAVMTTIRWTARAKGGVPENNYEFYTRRGTEEKVQQTGPSPDWDWTPVGAGNYRIKVIVRDALGNAVDSGWSPEYEIVPELTFEEVVPDRAAPQVAAMTTINWTAIATGGVGALTCEFHTLRDSKETVEQAGESFQWDWTPAEAGNYRVKVVVKDALGNTVDSDWSPDYRIEPELLVDVVPDRAAPQAAAMTTIRWTAGATGGVGDYSYEFHMIPSDKKDKVVQTGFSPDWDWTPAEAGNYRVKVVVKDALGNTVDSGWSPDYRIEPELKFEQAVYDRKPPQVAGMTAIRWTAKATGGVGAYTYEFRTLRESAEILEQTGPSSSWDWVPLRAGQYRIKTVVRDSVGNAVESDWSPAYEIAPPLVVEQPVPDRQSPQAIGLTTIWWAVKSTGGVGAHTYEFYLLKDSKKKVVQTGTSSEWRWSPEGVGNYRVKAVVRDALGNTVDSGWSSEYEIKIFPKIYGPIAVMPVENISKQVVPVSAIRQSMKAMLMGRGLTLVDDDVLERFMTRHRIRYTGGLDRDRARAFREEDVAGAVLISSVEHYDERYPPKVAITARLVSTKDKPEILWIDSAGLAGDDSPEILGVGLVRDPRVLLMKTVQQLSDSFALFLKSGNNSVSTKKKGWLEETRFDPKVYHRSSAGIDRERGYTVAVLPFFNRSERKYAGEIMQLHFVKEMEKLQNFAVIEPGVARDSLLKLRVIMFGGISLNNAEAIFSMLDVDLILTGTVIDYKDYIGPQGKPKVDFSVLLLDRKSRETVWSSKSYNEGDDDVYFFDMGKVNTCSALASEMVRAVVKKMVAK
jgi:hypothetical protein